MKESGWRIASRNKLGQIWQATPRKAGESDQDYAKRLKQAIAKGYPFSQRSGFAYQCWLSERTRFLHGLGLGSAEKKPKRVQKSKPEPIAPGQLSLLGGDQ